MFRMDPVAVLCAPGERPAVTARFAYALRTAAARVIMADMESAKSSAR